MKSKDFIQEASRSRVHFLKCFLSFPLLTAILMFGVTDTSEHDNCISYLFLCLKFYIHRCKFQESDLSFVAFMNLVKTKRKIFHFFNQQVHV